MKRLTITLLSIFVSACGPKSGQYDVNVSDSEHVIRVENPIIEFCERLHPPVLYPNDIERETLTVACMKLCSESGQCQVILPPDLLQTQNNEL